MKETICSASCIKCGFYSNCPGCSKTNGAPFGKPCFIAKYITIGGHKNFAHFKQTLLDECNAVKISGMPKINDLYPICGCFINLEYPLPNGQQIKLLDDKNIYLGNQIQCSFDSDHYFGVAAAPDFLLISEYGINGDNPEILWFKKR